MIAEKGQLVRVILPLLFLLTMTAGAGHTAEVAGINLPEKIRVGDTDCGLAAYGVRSKLFIKVYAAGFYLEGTAAGLNDLVEGDRTKAVLMSFIYRKVDSDKLKKAWRDGFALNSPEAGSDLRERMEEFIDLFSAAAVSGDEILIAYRPGEGTSVSLNGRRLGLVPGHDLIRALMLVWLGESPADKGLKRSVVEQLGR